VADYQHLSGMVIPLDPDKLIPQHAPWCFGCGQNNPEGLGLRTRMEDGVIVATVELHARFSGAPGIAHGGAAASILDDVLGFIPFARERLAVTRTLETHFLAPVPVERQILARAWLTAERGRKLWTEGTIETLEGRVLVEATALFVSVDPTHFESIHAERS
jgi:acyl-coenzyme A thioesterase PaaI-like protein